MDILNINGLMVPHNIHPIIGDGACLFRAISFQVYGGEILSCEVRQEIVDHVVQHWEDFKIMSHDNWGNNYNSAEEYKKEMSLPFTYGSLCELVAAGQIFQTLFEVYRNGNLYEKFGRIENPVARLRFTNDLSNGHFDVYLPSANDNTNQKISTSDVNGLSVAKKRRTRVSDNVRRKQRRVSQAKTQKQTNENHLLPWKVKPMAGMNYEPNLNYEEDKSVNIGAMINKCIYCCALKWKDETPGMCCSSGKVQLPSYEAMPEPLNSLIMDLHPEHSHFMDRIRKYNSCFQMTSFGAKKIIEDGFMPTFKVQGQVYHLIGSLLPPTQEQPKFLQIYFVGEDHKEASLRCRNCPGVKESLVRQLQNMMHQNNSYIKEFKTAIGLISYIQNITLKKTIQVNTFIFSTFADIFCNENCIF